VSNRERATGAGRWPWGLLGLFALVWVVESSVARHRFGFLDLTSVTWVMTDRAARREAMACEVLCFGDSLSKFGIVPAVIERRTGKPAYNLAVNAGRAPTTYFLLRRVLEAGARPAAVLVDFEPGMLAAPPTLAPELWAELLGPRDCAALAWAARDFGFLARTLLPRYLPCLRYRPQLREAVLAAVRGERVVPPDDPASLRRNAGLNRGALVMPHRDDRPPREVNPPNPIIYPEVWGCHPLNARFLLDFFKLASAHGVPVFWVLTPYPAPIQSRRERLGPDATFTRFVARVQARFPGLTVLDARRSNYDPSVFWDGLVHLDGRGALTLSTDVASALSARFTGGSADRWVRLPTFGDRPATLPLEDVSQSEVALRASRTRTR
jgi:hypothetical protein